MYTSANDIEYSRFHQAEIVVEARLVEPMLVQAHGSPSAIHEQRTQSLAILQDQEAEARRKCDEAKAEVMAGLCQHEADEIEQDPVFAAGRGDEFVRNYMDHRYGLVKKWAVAKQILTEKEEERTQLEELVSRSPLQLYRDICLVQEENTRLRRQLELFQTNLDKLLRREEELENRRRCQLTRSLTCTALPPCVELIGMTVHKLSNTNDTWIYGGRPFPTDIPTLFAATFRSNAHEYDRVFCGIADYTQAQRRQHRDENIYYGWTSCTRTPTAAGWDGWKNGDAAVFKYSPDEYKLTMYHTRLKMQFALGVPCDGPFRLSVKLYAPEDTFEIREATVEDERLFDCTLIDDPDGGVIERTDSGST
jgi:hypothetical protein